MKVIFGLVFLLSTSVFASEVIKLEASDKLWDALQEAVTTAPEGSIIELPEGKFNFHNEVIINKSHITIKGKGHKKTILSFINQKIGAQGILATEDAFTIEDLAIEDTKGDGIKVEKADHVTFRGIRVEWTNGPDEKNGAYGFYPVQTSNVLIEDCIVIGASDAGIYVGQSKNIIVRRNYVYKNVAGIEIENSSFADVYENTTVENTAGILVFDLPNLKVKGGAQARVFNNKIYRNNTRNFAPPGNIVGHVPSGTGVMIIANDDVEIFNNEIKDNDFTGIILANYLVTEYVIKDDYYDPRPDKIYIHDNIITNDSPFFSKVFESEMHFLVNYLSGMDVADIIWDGIKKGKKTGRTAEDDRICIQNNFGKNKKPSTYANLQLGSGRSSLFGMIPGGPAKRELKEHNCAHRSLKKIVLTEPVKIENTVKAYTKAEIESLCNSNSDDINWNAFEVDCPKLSDYNLFKNKESAMVNPVGDNSHPYSLSAPLFTDYALKDRFIFMPKGESMDYNADRTFTFPENTIITKTFSYPEDFAKKKNIKQIETRILIKRKDGWKALPYVWDQEKGEAFLSRTGKQLPVSFIRNGKKTSFTYTVPSQNQCFSCHGIAGKLKPIGPQAKSLNFEHEYADGVERNQLAYLRELRVLTGLHLVDKAPKAPNYFDKKIDIVSRARSYLHANCAHCHSPMGRAKTSGLFLEFERDINSIEYGNCKPPVAAGRGAGELKYTIHPGHPRKSILIHRMDSDDPGSMMPEIGRGLIHREGVELMEAYIKQMKKSNCD